MDDEQKRALQLQALQNLRDKRLDEAQKARISTPDRSVNLASGSLDKDILRASGGSMSADVTEPIRKIKGTDVIDSKEVQKITSGSDFAKKMSDLDLKQNLKSSFKAAAEAGDEQMMNKLRKIAANLGKAGSKGLKALPIVGGVASAILGGAEDASAAIPVLDSADSVGMSAADENQMIAETEAKIDYENSQAKKDALAKLLKNKQ